MLGKSPGPPARVTWACASWVPALQATVPVLRCTRRGVLEAGAAVGSCPSAVGLLAQALGAVPCSRGRACVVGHPWQAWVAAWALSCGPVWPWAPGCGLHVGEVGVASSAVVRALCALTHSRPIPKESWPVSSPDSLPVPCCYGSWW